jgi:hypothetical protein
MAPVRLMGLLAASVAVVGAGTASAATQYDFDIVSASGTITTDISGSWDNDNVALSNPATGEPYPKKATGTVASTVRWTAKPKKLGASFPLPSIAGATKGTAVRIPLRGVTGSAQGSLAVTLGDGSTRSCAPGGVALSRAFFSDSAANDLFVALFGRGNLKAYLRGGYPWHAFSGSDPCSEGLDGLALNEAAQTFASIPRGKVTGAKKGKRVTLNLSHRVPVTGKVDGATVTVGSVSWKTTLVLRFVGSI